MNAPEAGIIREFLAKEEDTVTVGQDLVKLEVGAAEGNGKTQGGSEPKKSASGEQATSSDPQPKEPESKEPKVEKDDKSPSKSTSPPPSAPPTSEHHRAKEAPAEPGKTEQPQKSPTLSSSRSQKGELKSNAIAPALGNRDERRVSPSPFWEVSNLRD